MMDIKRWLTQQQKQADDKLNDPNTYMEDGVLYDIPMSTKFGDVWFFSLINKDWKDVVPGLSLETAVYAMAQDCMINLFLNGWEEEEIEHMMREAMIAAKDIRDNH